MYAQIQLSDAIVKYSSYLTRICSSTQYDQQLKLCHLALQTLLKFNDSQQFAKDVYQKTKQLLFQKRNYFLLYLIDLLLKNSKFIIKLAKKEVEKMFQVIWEKVWTEFNPSSKLENLKLMAITWGAIYGSKHLQNLSKWVLSKYSANIYSISPIHHNKLIETYGSHMPRFDSVASQGSSKHDHSTKDGKKSRQGIQISHKRNPNDKILQALHSQSDDN